MRSTPSGRRPLLLAVVVLVSMSVAGPASAAAPRLRPYVTSGALVTGTPEAAQGPRLLPGRYLDRFTAANEDTSTGGRYYRVTLHRGDTPYFAATQVPPARKIDTGSMQVTISLSPLVAKPSGCGFIQSGYSFTSKLNTTTAVLSPGRVGGPTWSGSCPVDAVYALRIARTGSAFPTEPVPTEIVYRSEPQATTTGSLPPAVAGTNLVARSSNTTANVTGGRGFADAPVLSRGQYRDTVTSGETRYYRVHLAWGQRLAYTLTAERDPRIKDFAGAFGHMTIINPVRQVVDQADRARKDESDLGATGGAMFGSTPVPVRYTNRDSTDADIRAFAIDGDYYLAMSTDYPDADEAVSVGFTLLVDVVGRRETGPTYTRGGPVRSATSTGSVVPVALWTAGAGIVVLIVLIVPAVVVRRRRRRGRVPL